MTPLGREIAETIAQDGPITVARYMFLCLGHPVHGYYATREPFGARGDFVTAPEISQIFGELLGLWAAETWVRMGAPARVALVELGPGRGTLMADALRAARALPAFFDAIEVTLVETSPTLRDVQARTLERSGKAVRWRQTVEDALAADPSPLKGEGGPARSDGAGGDRPEPCATPKEAPTRPRLVAEATLPMRRHEEGEDAPLPSIVIANEFFDALAVRQFVRTAAGWRERMVGLDEAGGLAFGLGAAAPADVTLPERPENAVLELNTEGLAIAARLGAHVAAHGGAVLAIDYGGTASAGDTFQAVRGHGFADPLVDPGEADLTAQVDFGALARAATAGGAAPLGPITQADLMKRLGIDARAERLKRAATPDQAAAIDMAVARLTDRAPKGMGALFKALCFADPRLAPPPAFESHDGAL